MKEWIPAVRHCVTCGCTFVQRKQHQRSCADCIAFGTTSYALRRKRRAQNESSLDMNIKTAEAAGMSYGKYKASLYVQTWTLRGKVMK